MVTPRRQRDRLRPAHHTVLLCSAGGVDQGVEPTGGADVEPRPQRRQVLGAGGEDGLGDQPEVGPAATGPGGAPEPGLERLAVEAIGIGWR